MDLTARPQPKTFWELLRCCKTEVDEFEGNSNGIHNTIFNIPTDKKGVSSPAALDCPQTQSTIDAGKPYFGERGSNTNACTYCVIISKSILIMNLIFFI